jgi:hypothetical protein
MTTTQRRKAIADLPAHPGYKALLEELEAACNDVLVQMRDASGDAHVLKLARDWQAMSRFYGVLRDTPDEIWRIIEQEKNEADFDPLENL